MDTGPEAANDWRDAANDARRFAPTKTFDAC